MTLLWMLLFGFVVAILLAWLRWLRLRAGERASRPHELKAAHPVYMERQFRSRGPISIVARLDRAYRLQNGRIVLVELKTRAGDRAYPSDIIQLSAQKLALEGEAGEEVESYAFVTVLRPDHPRRWRSHRVTLLDSSQLQALARRREAVLDGRATPTYAASNRACAGCALRPRCDRPDTWVDARR
jgi:CRISPR-associated exonuclease Cas4